MAVAASVLSCNSRSHSFTFPRTVFLAIFPRRKGLSRTLSLLHLFGSSAACCFMPFPLRMYYILVSSSFRPPMSSITEAGHPTLTAAFFGCKYSQPTLYPRFSPLPAQFPATCPRIDPPSLPHSFLACQFFHFQRNTLLHHHDTSLSLIATFFSGVYSVAFSFTPNTDYVNTVVPSHNLRFTPMRVF